MSPHTGPRGETGDFGHANGKAGPRGEKVGLGQAGGQVFVEFGG
jgi:hypothetical protein